MQFTKESHPRLFEFERKRKRKGRKSTSGKPLSPQHKQSISKGLQDYYGNQTRRPETFLDKAEKATKSIDRLARAGKTAMQAVGIGSSIRDRYRRPSTRDNIREGVGIISSLSTSASRLGNAAKSATSSANTIDDLRRGSKKIKENLAKNRIKSKNRELSIKEITSKSYEKLVNDVVSRG